MIEIAGIGPTQLTGMLLADMGAEIVRVERLTDADLGLPMAPKFNLMNRSRRSLALDLKHPEGVATILKLCEKADALFEGFRPGVMERLGLGPEVCLARNERLAYGRMTGWGQEGPLASTAGHDPNYIAIAGALGCIGEVDRAPVQPLNLIGDFGGGALYLAVGLLAAMLEAQRSGKGQIVDTAMVDGVASMMTMFYGLLAGGLWQEQRGANILDGGAHFVGSYLTMDGNYVTIAPIEGRFYQELLDKLGIDDPDLRNRQMDAARWPEFKEKLAAVFATKTQQEWIDVFADSDACFSPVLTPLEALRHAHARARDAYVDVEGITQPAPAPRFSRTPSRIQAPPSAPGADGETVLAEWGFSADEIAGLLAEEVVRLSG
jgi:alpha-methylacyl-CoA racemase